MLGEKPALEDSDNQALVDADEIFNRASQKNEVARKATKQPIQVQSFEQDPIVNEFEDENIDPQDKVHNSPNTPQINNDLRRKSRAIVKRRYTQDGERSQNDENDQEASRIEDEDLAEATEAVRLPSNLKRRATRSIAPKMGLNTNDSNDPSENESVDHQIDNEEEMPNANALKRRTRSVAISKNISLNASHHTPPPAQASLVDTINESTVLSLEHLRPKRRLASNKSFLNALDNVKRSQTPEKTATPVVITEESINDDVRRASAPRNIANIVDPNDDDVEEDEEYEDREDVELSFHPNIESTRVGLQQFGDDEERSSPRTHFSRRSTMLRSNVENAANKENVSAAVPLQQTSPKASSRKRSASRINNKTRIAALDEDDRGSYLTYQRPSQPLSTSQSYAPAPVSIEKESSRIRTPVLPSKNASQMQDPKDIIEKVIQQEERRRSREVTQSSGSHIYDHGTSPEPPMSEYQEEALEADHEDDHQEREHGESDGGRRLSQQQMPPPPTPGTSRQAGGLTEPRTSRRTLTDSILGSKKVPLSESMLNLILNEEEDNEAMSKAKPQTQRRVQPKKRNKSSNLYDYPFTEKKLKVMYKGEINRNATKQEVENFYEEAMTRMRHQTGGQSAKLGDWRDLLVHFKFIPEHDPWDAKLYKLLRTYLCETQYIHLIPYPMLDGTGTYTLPLDIWEKRALDDDFNDEDLDAFVVYGEKKRKRRKKKKTTQSN